QLDDALDLVAAAQAEAADHRQRHVDVVGAGRVRAHPQEAVAVLGADVQGAGAGHLGAVVLLPAAGVAALHHPDAAVALLEAVAGSAAAWPCPAAGCSAWGCGPPAGSACRAAGAACGTLPLEAPSTAAGTGAAVSSATGAPSPSSPRPRRRRRRRAPSSPSPWASSA